jgi:hypothetical protein
MKKPATATRRNGTVRCAIYTRVEAAERRLRVGRIGQPEGADPVVAPRLAHEPSESVATVLGLAQVLRETTARMIAATAVLIDDSIAVPDNIGGASARDCGLVIAAVRSDRLGADLS